MNKLIFSACLVVGAAGCFGSNPDENSQIYGDAAASSTGTAGTGGPGTGGTGGGGTGNGPIVGSPLGTFDTGLDGFAFGTYDERRA